MRDEKLIEPGKKYERTGTNESWKKIPGLLQNEKPACEQAGRLEI